VPGTGTLGGTGRAVGGGEGGAGGVGTPRGVGGGAGGVAGGTGVWAVGGGEAGVAGGIVASGPTPGGHGVLVVAVGAVGVFVACLPSRARAFRPRGFVEFSGVAVVPFDAVGAPAWLIGTHGYTPGVCCGVEVPGCCAVSVGAVVDGVCAIGCAAVNSPAATNAIPAEVMCLSFTAGLLLEPKSVPQDRVHRAYHAASSTLVTPSTSTEDPQRRSAENAAPCRAIARCRRRETRDRLSGAADVPAAPSSMSTDRFAYPDIGQRAPRRGFIDTERTHTHPAMHAKMLERFLVVSEHVSDSGR